MANNIIIKRSSTPGSVPALAALALGELAINTNDGRLFLKMDNGTPAIIEVTNFDASRLATGTLPAARLPALSGDVTSSAGSNSLALINTGTAGTYTKVTTDAKGRVISGTAAAIADITNLQTSLDTKLENAQSAFLDRLRITRSYQLATNFDLDSLFDGGFYDGVSLIHTPTGGGVADSNWWYIFVQRHSNSSSYVSQQAWRISSTTLYADIYIRSYQASAWQPWVRLANANDVAAATDAGNLTSGTLASGRLPAFAGDVISTAGTNTLTLASQGLTPGSYTKVTVNAKGLVVGTANIAAADLPTFIGASAGAAGTKGAVPAPSAGDQLKFFRADGTWQLTPNTTDASLLTSGTLASGRLPAFIGDATSSAGSNSLTLANSGVVAGTWTKPTFDAKGRAISGANLSNVDIPAFTGSTGSVAGTLGGVPAPGISDNTKFLKGNSTWVPAVTPDDDGNWYASMYGVSPANSAATNTTALNALIAIAVAVAPYGGKIVLPRGQINVNNLNTISNVNGLIICSTEKFATELRFNSTSGNGITFSGGAHSGVRDLYITSAVHKTNDYAIAFIGQVFMPIAINVRIDYHYNGIYIQDCSEAEIDVVLRYLYGYSGVRVEGTSSIGSYGCNILIKADNPYPIGYGVVRPYSNGLAVNRGDIVYCPNTGCIYNVSTAGNLGSSEPSAIGGAAPINTNSTPITSGSAQLILTSRLINWIAVSSMAFSVRVKHGSFVINGFRGLLMDDPLNTGSSAPQWVYAPFLEVDHPLWNGIDLYRGKSFYSSDGWFGSSLYARGLIMDPGFLGDVGLGAGCRIMGNYYEGAYFSGAGGAKNIRIMGSTIEQNGQANYNVHANVAFFSVVQFMMVGTTMNGANTKVGFYLNNGCNGFAIIGNYTWGNVSAGYDNQSGTATGSREVFGNIY